MTSTKPQSQAPRTPVYRHSVPVRITHWVNVLLISIMLMTGLQIFNAHPALYWGSDSDFERPLLSMDATQTDDGRRIGVTNVFGFRFDTSGVLGLSTDAAGDPDSRGFPSWATIPSFQSLSKGRRWHFFFAWFFVINGLVYAAYSVFARHLWRDLIPSREELKRIGNTVLDHMRLRFPEGEAATRYNVLQKLTYVIVALILGPLVVLTGLTMSPWIDSAFPWILDIFGGRQSVRSIHFLCAFTFVAFVIVHVLMVLLSGVWNNLRSMITGRYVITHSGGE